jgi:hypothetical protein
MDSKDYGIKEKLDYLNAGLDVILVGARAAAIVLEDFYNLVDAANGPVTYIGYDGKTYQKDLAEIMEKVGPGLEKVIENLQPFTTLGASFDKE